MKKASLFLLPLAVSFPIEKLSNVFLVLFLLTQLILFFLKKIQFTFTYKIFKNPLVILFFFTFFLLKLRTSLGGWDRDLSLLLLPIFFSFREFKQEDIYFILKWFVYFLGLGLITCLFYEIIAEFYFNNYVNEWKLVEHYKNNHIFYLIHSISERIGFHHIYLSLYLFFGFIISHWLLNEKVIESKNERSFVIILMIFFFLFSFLSISRMTIISFIIYFLGVVFYSLKKRNKINYGLIIFFIFIGVSTVFFSNKFTERFKNIKNDPRINLFNLSVDLSQEAFFLGYGARRGEELLIEKQRKEGGNVYYNNPHNQYLDYLLKGGGLMLLFFLTLLFLLSKYFIVNNLYIGYIFVFFFALQCLTEALMERYRGIILFSFLISIFLKLVSFKSEKKIIN